MRRTVHSSRKRSRAWHLLSPEACRLGSVTRGQPRCYRGATNVHANTLGAEGQCGQILRGKHSEGKQVKGQRERKGGSSVGKAGRAYTACRRAQRTALRPTVAPAGKRCHASLRGSVGTSSEPCGCTRPAQPPPSLTSAASRSWVAAPCPARLWSGATEPKRPGSEGPPSSRTSLLPPPPLVPAPHALAFAMRPLRTTSCMSACGSIVGRRQHGFGGAASAGNALCRGARLACALPCNRAAAAQPAAQPTRTTPCRAPTRHLASKNCNIKRQRSTPGIQ